MIVTINDIRLAGHCGRGARVWFRRHFAPDGKVVFEQFLKSGMPADAFLAAGDDLARQVVEAKRVRDGQDQPED